MTPAGARAAIRALRVGAAPANHVAALGVGQEAISRVLERALEGLSTGDRPSPILVEGRWGSGKSHTLALGRALSRARHIATATVTFNARSAALSHPNRVYCDIVQGIELRGLKGVRSVVLHLLNDAETRGKLAGFVAARQDPFGHALAQLHRAHSTGDGLLLGHSGAWAVVLGNDLVASDTRARKAAAVSRLGALAELMRICGFGGLAILGDELESLGQLWNSISRAGAYNALGALVDLPSTMWVFGAAGNFERVVSDDLERGMRSSWRLSDPGRSFFSRWCSGGFRRLAPAVLDREDAERLATVVAEIHELGYGPPVEPMGDRLTAQVRSWADDASRDPRRLARGLVESLDATRTDRPGRPGRPQEARNGASRRRAGLR